MRQEPDVMVSKNTVYIVKQVVQCFTRSQYPYLLSPDQPRSAEVTLLLQVLLVGHTLLVPGGGGGGGEGEREEP